MNSKTKYREFCQTEKDIPIFSKDWWLDTVCGEGNWDVALVEKGGQIAASMPYFMKKESIFTIITMPKLSQTMGPYIKYPKGQKYYKHLSWEKKMMTSLIDQLPSYDSLNLCFHYSVTNWLPFYWKGFNQSTRYTYIIENISVDDLEKNIETDIRRRRRKAEEAGIDVYEGDEVRIFYAINKKTFVRQGMEIPYSFEEIYELYNTCKQHHACKMYFAKEEDGNVIAANFLVYDSNTVYYIMGGIDPEKKDIGGMDALQIESIKFALENDKTFDFEGSMIESVEKYFRSFGAIQKPYFQIYKTNSKLWRFKNLVQKGI